MIDLWKETSVGRCTYHVGPPDGGIYTARPLNAGEAEERRRARFQVRGTRDRVQWRCRQEELNPIFPMTLDLRMQTSQRKGPIERRRADSMTVDLYQSPLRYGAFYDELSADGVKPRPHWASA